MCPKIHTHTFGEKEKKIHTHTHPYIHTLTHTYIHTYTHTCIVYIHTTHTHIDVSNYTQILKRASEGIAERDGAGC